MINRFNFYDLYGYVLPGLTLITGFWLPYALAQPQVKAPDIAVAVALLILSYLVGHLIQVTGSKAFTSKRKDSRGVLKHPSEILLEGDAPKEVSLPPGSRERIRAKIVEWFGENACNPGELGFFLCRTALIQRGKSAYAEQMQGMYTLMRGLTTAFLLLAAYFLAWNLSIYSETDIAVGLIAAFIIIAPIAGSYIYEDREFLDVVREQKAYVIGPVIAVIIGGVMLGGRCQSSVVERLPLGWFSLLALLIAFLTFGSHKAFAVEFAKTVYRDFLVLEKREESTNRVSVMDEADPG